MLARVLIVLLLTSGFALSPLVARAETASSSSAIAVEDPSVFDVGRSLPRVDLAVVRYPGHLCPRPSVRPHRQNGLSTPAIAEDRRVKDLWGFSLGIADATLLMFLLAGAAVVAAIGGCERIPDHSAACWREVEGRGGRPGDPQKVEGHAEEAAPESPGESPQYPAQSGAQYAAQYPAQWRVRGVAMREMAGGGE